MTLRTYGLSNTCSRRGIRGQGLESVLSSAESFGEDRAVNRKRPKKRDGIRKMAWNRATYRRAS